MPRASSRTTTHPASPFAAAKIDGRAWYQVEAPGLVRSEASVRPDALPEPEPLDGRALANLSVRQEGLVRVTGHDLVLAGVSLTEVDARRLQLYQDGRELALRVTGEADGVFDLTDSIPFYGQPSESRDSAFRVYRLIHGSSTGLRMAQRDDDAGAAARGGSADQGT